MNKKTKNKSGLSRILSIEEMKKRIVLKNMIDTFFEIEYLKFMVLQEPTLSKKAIKQFKKNRKDEEKKLLTLSSEYCGMTIEEVYQNEY